MRFSIQLFVLLTFCLLPFITYASDCLINNTTTPNGATAIGTNLAGQQFIACETGTISTIQVNTSGGDLHLYLVAGDGTTITYGSPYQVFTGQAAGLITLTLNTPFQVQKGALNSFAIGNVTEVIFDMDEVGPPANDTDPDGRFAFQMTNAGAFSEIQASDLVFGVQINATPIPVPVSTPIPTLAQWGLLIFGLLILNLSLWALRRKTILLKSN